MSKRRIKKKIKVIFILIIMIILALFATWLVFFIREYNALTEYNDQYIEGLVFSDVKYQRKTLKYCYHELVDINVSDTISIVDNDNILASIKLDEECGSISLEKAPENISFEVNNIKSVNSTEELEQNFKECDDNPDFPYEDNENINETIKELNKYLSGKSVGIYYDDINSDFSYGYNENKVFYGASLIKLPEALYLIDEAINGNISLEDTVTLGSYYYNLGNDGLKSNKVGSKVTIRNLIKYMLETSDNGAHLLLFDTYTNSGTKLTEYEKNLGSTNPYQRGTDKFGFQTALATNVYLKHAYDLMINNSEYGTELKEYMVNDFYNNLKLDDGIKVAHKYGYVTGNPKLHDIGIVFNNHPYTISVLTLYNKTTGESFINNVHSKIKVLHELYYSEKTNYCINTTYFNN